MSIGWIKLHRQIHDHKFWRERRRFSKAEAWLDLLMSANWEDSTVLRGYQLIDVKRGQVFTSAVALAQRWRWNRKSVVSFLLLLKADIMADIKTSHGRDTGFTLITILNYEKYQAECESGLDIKNDSAADTKPDIKGTFNWTYQRRIKKKEEDKSDQGKLDGVSSSPKIKRKPARRAPADPAQLESFARFYEAYPRHVGKADAEKAWIELAPAPEFIAAIMAGVERYAESVKDSEPKYIKHPGPWLRSRRWEDDLEKTETRKEPKFINA